MIDDLEQIMKVLLIQPPIEDFYTTPIRLYPLGLLYAAQVLMQLEVEVQVLDCLTPLKKKQLPIAGDFAYLRPFIKAEPLLFQHYYRFGLDPEAIINAVHGFAPDLIGISSQFTAYYKNVAELAALIRDHYPTPIFIGGNHATVFADEIRQKTPFIDHVLSGPAENTLPAFISTLRGSPATGSGRMDWKTLLPAHELLDGDGYRIGRRNYISITASRGCPYACDFCSVQAMFGDRIDYRRVEDVLTEMRINYMRKNVHVFNFEDDNIAVNKRWFTALLEAICADRTLQEIELTAMNGIGYTHLDAPLLELMRKAGFRQLNLSYVTHDSGLRRRYHRPVQRRDIAQVIAMAQQFGFFITVYVIIGLPDQTYAEIKASIDYLLDLGVLVGPSVFYIPPGSALYNRLRLPAEIVGNWNLYRSSAFAVETRHLSRADLVELFAYTRRRNLENKKSRPSGP